MSVYVDRPPPRPRCGAEAGQFLVWRFLGRRGWTRANPYSLSAAPDGRSLRITVQDVGDGSASLAALRPGTRVAGRGTLRAPQPAGPQPPQGRAHRRRASASRRCGPLAEGLDYAPGEAVLLHRHTERPALRPRARRARAPSAACGVAPAARAAPRTRRPGSAPACTREVDDLQALRHWVPDVAERDVYVCGPQAWTDLVRADLLRAGLPPEHLHLETFGW